MGSPLSPILADIVMENLLKTATRQLPFDIPVIRKYVDDLFMAIPKDKVQYTLDMFNSYNPHLQFTKEEESNNKLPFLDTIVTRQSDQTMSTMWYAKPISSNRLLNFLSFHPLSMKINVAVNFIKRVTSLSTSQDHNFQRNVIFHHLRTNNYPTSLINRLMTRNNSPNNIKRITDTPSSNGSSINNNIDFTYRSLPHIPSLSTTIASILKADYPQVKITQKPIKTIARILPSTKYPIDPMLRSNVIYSISCEDCNMCYIGMTRNQLKTRLYGHNSNINQYHKLRDAGKNSNDEQMNNLGEKTALIQHMIQHNHTFNTAQAKIIDRTYRSSSLPILEMCHITNTTNTINHRTDVDGLNTIYAGILHTIKATTSRRKRGTTERKMIVDHVSH
ncbi:uncharacterized protein LOC131429013 [Malaya genurostris]|uniref:uncharacterized protein LOC131429013 n=1 Tax=Malaya genurostris TaxID=325434 RepID=UPI0026F3F202|nr:uncharacterized protein LOC131429013 [Malaya genurostris]